MDARVASLDLDQWASLERADRMKRIATLLAVGRFDGVVRLMASGGRADSLAHARQAKKRGKSHSADEA